MKQTTELLKRFCELAPPEWECRDYSDEEPTMMWFWPKDGWDSKIILTDDRISAEAIIFLWDWLDGQGLNPLLRNEGTGKAVVCGSEITEGVIETEEGLRYVNGKLYSAERFPVERKTFEAPTRIEALVCACVAVLEAKAVAA